MNYPDANDLYEGKFTDGDSIAGIAPSVDSADYTNAIYDELIALIQAGGLTADNDVLTQASASIQKQIYGQRIFTATGTANDLVLTSSSHQVAISELADYDQIKVAITTTNTDVVTISLDGMDALNVANVAVGNQLFAGALATFIYLDGSLHLTDQINPKTGNTTRDIGKLIVDTTSVLEIGEIALDGATLSRADYPIMWAKIQATSNLIAEATKNADLQSYAGYYGDGDGSTTFTLPTLGGEFIRLVDNGRGVDTDRIFGSWQDYNSSRINRMSTNTSYADYGPITVPESGISGSFDVGGTATVGTTVRTIALTASGGETRPRNIAYYAKTRI